ncbi:glycosyltransferase family 87 protein [Sphingomonas qomolangmaensis]|uniref:DUF2029 domain-containing protein n=1 Tax=Sphingomonas qomolangmaensis TaxID=2918765 RepID=A0ABY5L4A5_9SPHN|nr:glycosyltransferase family 87 protein [Sphingomonas qomolangmaensis]UUL81800.1 DUF2029 domain-containing protein [Sphingomonas qomolangmaensis]
MIGSPREARFGGSEPRRGWTWLAPWIVGNLVVLGLFALDLRHLDGGMVSPGAYWGRDFVNVWTAGRLLIEGRLELLYDLAGYHRFQLEQFGRIGQHNYSYPPLALPLALPFGLLPYPVALLAWLGATGWFFVRAARSWWVRATGLPAWLVLATPAGLVNIWAGHYGFLIGGLLLYGWRNLEARPVLAGICFGLLAIKPHIAILVPLMLLARGEWRAIGAAAVTVVVLVAGSAALFGIDRWIEYITVTLGVQAALIDAGNSFFRFMSTSLATGLLHWSMPRTTAFAIHWAQAALAAAMVVHGARRGSTQQVALLAATATFLVLPYAFNYDLTVSAMAAGMLLYVPRLQGWERRLVLGGFMAAQLGMVLVAAGIPGIALLLWGLFVAQYRSTVTATVER